MSKGKNNNKNKVTKMPVKGQKMKPQKTIINKNFKEVKAAPIAMSKVLEKSVVKGMKKENENKHLNEKKIQKSLDIVESCDDEDESDVVSEDIDFDSDIDDVDLEDSEDNLDLDSNDEDIEGESDDCSDDNIEELDNSDYESLEMDENKVNEVDDDASEDKTPVEQKNKVAKKNETKVTKVVEKATKKEVTKVTVAKNEKEQVKTKVASTNEVIKTSKADEKILTEVNIRKNLINNCVVFVNKLHPTITREKMTALLKPIEAVQINIPHKMKKKVLMSRGYGFIRLATEKETEKVIELLNDKEVNGIKMCASKFVCKKVFGDMSKIDLTRIVVHSFKSEDITTELKSHFKVPVFKHMNTQYELAFIKEADASTLFDKKTMTLNGRELIFNYLYTLKPRPVVSESEDVVEVKVEIKAEVQPVKAGIKRSRVDSDNEKLEEEVKKTKLNNGTQLVKKTQVQKPKIEVKKVAEPAKKPAEVKKTQEVKVPVNKKEFNKFPQNKAAGDKKHNPKAQDNKTAKKQQPGKKMDKSPGKNKQGNKKAFNKKK